MIMFLVMYSTPFSKNLHRLMNLGLSLLRKVVIVPSPHHIKNDGSWLYPQRLKGMLMNHMYSLRTDVFFFFFW